MASNGLEWFRPMWRRGAVTGVCVVWSVWEWLSNHDQFWGILTLIMVAWSIWTFFITYDKNAGPAPDKAPPGSNPPAPPAPPTQP